MNSKEKEILKKLLKIATSQQKVIEKLAQDRGISPLDPNAPMGSDKGDPLADGLTDHRSKDQVTQDVYKNFPWLKPTDHKTAPSAPAAPASSLPPNVKAMLDLGAPGLKNNIVLTFGGADGKDVSVQFRQDKVSMRASEVKRVLQNALTGYRVGDPIGYLNPEVSTWHPNYL